jgi:hypothetical protein
MAEVFISFIHDETGYAKAVKSFLTQIFDASIQPFMSSDQLQVYAGERWLDRIMGELKTAKVVILMLSKKSVQRPWVNFEAGAAWTRDIVTIPVCYGGFRKADMPKPYSSLQGVELDKIGDDEYLAISVAHHLGIEKPVTRMTDAMSALGGDAYQKKCRRGMIAYDQLHATLRKLNEADPITTD